MRHLAWFALLLAGCGGASPPTATPPQSTERWEQCSVDGRCGPCPAGDTTTPRCQLILGALGPGDARLHQVLQTAERAPPRGDPRGPTLPAARTDGVASANDPALAAATAAYAQLSAMPFSTDVPASDASTAIHELMERVQSAAAVGAQVGALCEPLESTPGPTGVAAWVLHADALDLVASRTAGATIPLPIDLAAQIRAASPEVRTELQRQWVLRIGIALGGPARPVYCTAARLYRAALELDPNATRASAQLAAYGDEFLRSCE